MPAPPLSPVVSRSMKTARGAGSSRSGAIAESRMRSDVVVDQLAVADLDVAVPAIRLVAPIDRPGTARTRVVSRRPPRTSATRSRSTRRLVAAAVVGLVGQLTSRRCFAGGRDRRVRTNHRSQPRGQIHQAASPVAASSSRRRISEATFLAMRPGVAFRTDAGRTAGLARTPVDQLARALQQRQVHLEQRLAEADAARDSCRR